MIHFSNKNCPCSFLFFYLIFILLLIHTTQNCSMKWLHRFLAFRWNEYKVIAVYLFSSSPLMGSLIFWGFLYSQSLITAYCLIHAANSQVNGYTVNHLSTGLLGQQTPSSVTGWISCHQWLQVDAYHAHGPKHRN